MYVRNAAITVNIVEAQQPVMRKRFAQAAEQNMVNMILIIMQEKPRSKRNSQQPVPKMAIPEILTARDAGKSFHPVRWLKQKAIKEVQPHVVKEQSVRFVEKVMEN